MLLALLYLATGRMVNPYEAIVVNILITALLFPVLIALTRGIKHKDLDFIDKSLHRMGALGAAVRPLLSYMRLLLSAFGAG